MKRKYAMILSLMLSVLFASNAAAAESKMVPARQTLEDAGFVSQWDGETKTAVFKKDADTVSVTAGSGYFEINGKKVTFERAFCEADGQYHSAPRIIDGSFYLPDAELAQLTGAGTDKPEADEPVSLDLEKQRLSDMEGITNARQLGGYVNTEGRAIKQNVIIRTGAPSAGTENDLKLLSEKYRVSDMVDF